MSLAGSHDSECFLSECFLSECFLEFLASQVKLHGIAVSTARDELMPQVTDPQVRQIVSHASNRFEQYLSTARQSYQDTQDEAIGGGPDEDQEPIDEDEMDDEMDDDMWE